MVKSEPEIKQKLDLLTRLSLRLNLSQTYVLQGEPVVKTKISKFLEIGNSLSYQLSFAILKLTKNPINFCLKKAKNFLRLNI